MHYGRSGPLPVLRLRNISSNSLVQMCEWEEEQTSPGTQVPPPATEKASASSCRSSYATFFDAADLGAGFGLCLYAVCESACWQPLLTRVYRRWVW